jgi:ribosome-interacting GTPase 1
MGDSYTPRLELAVEAFVDCYDIVPVSTSEKVRVARMKQEWLDRLGLSRVIKPKDDEDPNGDDGADQGW